jgi:neogenin
MEESQIAGAPSELRVFAKHDSIRVLWAPPADNSVLIRGYIIGWGINIPDIEKVSLSQKIKTLILLLFKANVDAIKRQFTIKGLKNNREYVVSLRAFNNVGHGFPIYETVK